MTELNAYNLVFILWLVLLLLPLFPEIQIGSIKLKKQIEQTRTEVKESIRELKLQLLDIKIANSNSNTFVVNNQPLLSKDELSVLQRGVEPENLNLRSENTDSDFNIPNENIYLFQVRLSLEKQLSALCNFFQYGQQRAPYGTAQMVQLLFQHEVIDHKTASLIQEIIKIANRGVHGEIIDDDYIHFVRSTYPTAKKVLDKEYKYYLNNQYFFECPKCKYAGPSKYKNECPRCGFISDQY